jgi:cytochrome b561
MVPIIKNDLSEKYSKGTIIIHWATLLLILTLIPTGFLMAATKPSEAKLLLLRVYFFVGVTIFTLTLLRVGSFSKTNDHPNWKRVVPCITNW